MAHVDRPAMAAVCALAVCLKLKGRVRRRVEHRELPAYEPLFGARPLAVVAENGAKRVLATKQNCRLMLTTHLLCNRRCPAVTGSGERRRPDAGLSAQRSPCVCVCASSLVPECVGAVLLPERGRAPSHCCGRAKPLRWPSLSKCSPGQSGCFCPIVCGSRRRVIGEGCAAPALASGSRASSLCLSGCGGSGFAPWHTPCILSRSVSAVCWPLAAGSECTARSPAGQWRKLRRRLRGGCVVSCRGHCCNELRALEGLSLAAR